jgi:hypothetical protein
MMELTRVFVNFDLCRDVFCIQLQKLYVCYDFVGELLIGKPESVV